MNWRAGRRQPNGTHFSGAAQAARCQWSEIVVESREEPDGSRRSATKVSAIGRQPPVQLPKNRGADAAPLA